MKSGVDSLLQGILLVACRAFVYPDCKIICVKGMVEIRYCEKLFRVRLAGVFKVVQVLCPRWIVAVRPVRKAHT